MSNYIMREDLFRQLSSVAGFAERNGLTYQDHILIIAGERIPEILHQAIRASPSGSAALKILTKHNISFQHEYAQEF